MKFEMHGGMDVILRIRNFQGYQRNNMLNFHGLIKNEKEFPGVEG